MAWFHRGRSAQSDGAVPGKAGGLDRLVDIFVDDLDLPGLGFVRAAPARTDPPGYHPFVLLRMFIQGDLNRIPSSRRLKREAGRNVEVMHRKTKGYVQHPKAKTAQNACEG